MAGNSSFDAVPMAPTDPLFGLMAEYKADTDKYKVDLGVGAYRDDNAKPWVLPVVKKVREFPAGSEHSYTSAVNLELPRILWLTNPSIQADAIMRDDPELNHEYLPIAGLQSFTSAAARLILGADSPAIREQRVRHIEMFFGCFVVITSWAA